jgi:ankyrin repeat protein
MSNELHDCAVNGKLETVKQLVEGGTNINEVGDGGWTALLLEV